MFKLKRDLVAYRDGAPAMLERGSVVLAGDELLDEHPDDFAKA